MTYRLFRSKYLKNPMNTLLTAFLIQLVMCTVLFALLFYLVASNAKLKKEIESEAEKLRVTTKS